MKSMTYERAAVRQAPYMARTAQTPLYTTGAWGTAQTPYIRPARRAPAIPPVVTGGIEGVRSIS